MPSPSTLGSSAMVAPSVSASSRRYRMGSIAITWPAPMTRPAWMAPSPTGPAPKTATSEPGSKTIRACPAANPDASWSPSNVSSAAVRSVKTGTQYSSNAVMISLIPPMPARAWTRVPSCICANGGNGSTPGAFEKNVN